MSWNLPNPDLAECFHTVRVIETQHRWEHPVHHGAGDPSKLQFSQRSVGSVGGRIVS